MLLLDIAKGFFTRACTYVLHPLPTHTRTPARTQSGICDLVKIFCLDSLQN